ncbi:MAG: ATP-binding cassette domain-containing protein [Rhodospirillales bacterium]|nr:ATP-binding cassette domain-containing protein [Rhodospirillales bacterium]MBO6786394.1 ATP-binding cassette domain-containing protein [Rhodospirillales bacterium]
MSRANNRGTWRTIRRLEKSIPQVRWYRLELVLMSLFVNVFALGLPIFILQVYDRVLPNLGLTTMQFLVIGLIAVMLLDFFLKTARAAVTTYTGARFEHLARVSAVDHILRTPQDVYENDTPGAYLDKVNAIGVVKDFYSSQLGTLLIDLPFAIFFLGMIWFLGGVIVAVPLVLLALFGIMAIIVGGSLRRAVDFRSQVDNRRYDFLIEIINGIHTVKAQAFKNLLQRRFDPMQEMSARAVRSVAFKSSIAQSLGSTFGQLNMACVIGTGAVLVIDGSLTAGELAACTLLSGRAMQPLQSAMGLWTNFQTIRVACENAASVLELPAEDMSHLPEMPDIKGDLELNNVTFGYEGMEEPIIRNLSLDVKAGEIVGIDGDNSSGRSTLLKLMMGLIRPNSGAVLLDKHDLTEFQSKSYRHQMAFLTADSNVYSGTILDNMTYFRGGKYINKAIRIAKQLDLDEEIKRLPEGYGTHVGDGAGGVLPAGFVQRITVIRAMIDDPKVVLFDNANHGLDSNSDKTLMEYINSLRGKTTVILVTSRPSWLRMSDRRFMMSHGNLDPVRVEDPLPKLEKPAPALPSPTAAPVNETPAQPAPAAAQESSPAPTATPRAKSEPAPAQPAPQHDASADKAIPSTARLPEAVDTDLLPAPAANAARITAPRAEAAAEPARPAPAARPAPTATPRPKSSAQQPNQAPAARPAPTATPRPKSTAQNPNQAPAAPSAKPAPTATPRPKPAAQQPHQTPATQAAKPATTKTNVPAAKAETAAPAKPAPKAAASAPAPLKDAQAPAPARPKTQPAPQKQEPEAKRPAPASAPKPAAPKPAATTPAATPPKPSNDTTIPQPGTATFNPAPAGKKPAPKAAATLRPAPNAGKSTGGRRAVLKPQPPKARRTASFQPAAGGAE